MGHTDLIQKLLLLEAAYVEEQDCTITLSNTSQRLKRHAFLSTKHFFYFLTNLQRSKYLEYFSKNALFILVIATRNVIDIISDAERLNKEQLPSD